MSQPCFEDWIEDDHRPGGVGRSERQRVFWERVASGRPPVRPPVPPPVPAPVPAPMTISTPRARSPRQPESLEASQIPESRRNQERSGSQANAEGRWASVELAVVTMLTVVVFGLGWATFELEGEMLGTPYDESFRGLPAVVPGVSDD